MKTADTAHNEGRSAFAQAAELQLRDVSKREQTPNEFLAANGLS